jgi:ribosomal protein S27E
MPYRVRHKAWLDGETEPDSWNYSIIKTIERIKAEGGIEFIPEYNIIYQMAVAKSVFTKIYRQVLERAHAIRSRDARAGLHVRVQLIEWDLATGPGKVIIDRTDYVPPLTVPDRIRPFSEERMKVWEDRLKQFEELKKRIGIKSMYLFKFNSVGRLRFQLSARCPKCGSEMTVFDKYTNEYVCLSCGYIFKA